MKITDKDIEEPIIEQLRWDDRINDTYIYITVIDGNVEFDGFITSYYAKKIVTQNAKKINGVKSIENNLKVRYMPIPEKGIPSDKELQKVIKNTLNLNASMDKEKISVNVSNGIVTIEGTIYSFWKKDIAESIVSGFNGVKDIVNNLVIEHFEHSDEQIVEDIYSTLNRLQTINVDEFDFIVENGRVSVSGKVSDWEAYDMVLDAIRYTHGVKDIDINLNVENIEKLVEI